MKLDEGIVCSFQDMLKVVILLNCLYYVNTFNWSQAKNQTYLQWYLRYYRDHEEKTKTDSFPGVLQNLQKLVKENKDRSKTVAIETNYIQYYPGDCDIIIAVIRGGKLKPKHIPWRRGFWCKIDGHYYRFSRKICRFYNNITFKR